MPTPLMYHRVRLLCSSDIHFGKEPDHIISDTNSRSYEAISEVGLFAEVQSVPMEMRSTFARSQTDHAP